ncbi:MAG: tyrosine--tRNA ligase [Candidatus Diapherotrites archaeon]|nr:tyrosine--tRNA ligase [Candidatus Diapherotrites archaeon]
MNAQERFERIKRNTVEIVQEDELRQLLEQKKTPSGYIGFAATGRIHVGYLIPMMKVRDFVNAGFKFKLLLADLHAHLDDQKTPFELLAARAEYYKAVLSALCESMGTDMKKIEFVRGSDYQLTREYTLDMYRLAALNTFDRCKRAAAEVVRFGENPKLSGFLYPILQALDEQYLNVDVQYGGIDQRKILMFARENLPRIGYRARVEVMTPILTGLTGTKMSSSNESSKIDIAASAEEIRSRINKANCPISAEANGVLEFVRFVVLPLKTDQKKPFIIERAAKFGGNKEYTEYAGLEKDFLEGKLHPADLKNALAVEIDALLKPVRETMAKKKSLIEAAFPEK